MPRGPHALPQEEVIAHQRQRLLEAAAEAVSELGYSELTVRDLIDRSSVSRRTFYELFEGKLDCILAAHQEAVRQVRDEIARACAGQVAWPDGVAAAVSAVLEFTLRSPNQARLVLIACHTVSEPGLIGLALKAHEQFASILRTGRKRVSSPEVPGQLTEMALVGSVTAIVGERLCTGRLDGLRELAPELVQIILAPYLGHEEAQRFAGAIAA